MNITKHKGDAFLITNFNAIEETKSSVKQRQLLTNYIDTKKISTNKSKIKRRFFPVLYNNPIFIQNKAKKLCKKIVQAFDISQLNNIKYSKSNSFLPLIHSSKNHCFFKMTSQIIQSLIIDINIVDSQKIDILKKLYNLLKSSDLLEIQKKIAQSCVISAINCLKLCFDLNNLAIWHDVKKIDKSIITCYYNKVAIPLLSLDKNNTALQQLFLYPLSIDLLCIEEELRFLNEQDNSYDLGVHALDNEWLYMERCYRGFLYLLNTQINSKIAISFNDLRSVNVILGAYTTPNGKETHSNYRVHIEKDQACAFIHLVEQGIIYDEYLQDNNNTLSDDEKLIQLENKISLFFDVYIKLDKLIIDDKLFFIIKTDNNNTVTPKDSHQKLLDDLQGKTSNKAFLFTILKNDNKNKLSLSIQYCYDKNHSEVCQQLLDIYYHKIQQLAEDTNKKVSLAIWLCSLLQRIHPFHDANGRTLFFILLPILLYQMDMWLTRMIRYPWALLDFYAPEQMTEKIINLCFPAPIFAENISWDSHIATSELIRIYTGLGNIEVIKKLINQDSDLLNQDILITPFKRTMTLLEFTIIQNQTKMFDFLFNSLLNKKKIIEFDTLTDLLYFSYVYKATEIKAILILYIKNTFGILIDGMEQLKFYIV